MIKLAALAGAMLAIAQLPPQPANGTFLLYIVLALLSGPTFTLAYRAWDRRKAREVEERQQPYIDTRIIADSVQAATTAAKAMLEEYRAQLDGLRLELINVRSELAAAKERIALLEEALASTGGERDRFREDMAAAIKARAVAEAKLGHLQARVAQLEDFLKTAGLTGPTGPTGPAGPVGPRGPSGRRS